jgi:TetR/AcrR family transcriptional regulator
MNENFFGLPEEKRLRIIDAGFEVFSKSEYKKASMEEIASKAGISKALLFYYFHNKRALFLFLFDYAKKITKESVLDSHFMEITDFFELCEYAIKQKCRMLMKSPHVTDFFIRAFYVQDEEYSAQLSKEVEDETSNIYALYMKNIDFSKFREDVNPADILQMIIWLGEGYIFERQKAGLALDTDDMADKFKTWTHILKKSSYKEEHLDERSN